MTTTVHNQDSQDRLQGGVNTPKQSIQTFKGWQGSLFAFVAMVVALGWLYWPDLLQMQARWESNPHYSHGYLVPLFSIMLLASRRHGFRPAEWNSWWGGLVLLAIGLGLRFYSSYYYVESLSHLSLLVSLAGVTATVWGLKGLQWSSVGIGFLIFMVPLPHRIEGLLQGPLRTVGTKVSTFVLQILGLPAYNEGHVIVVGEQLIGVAEACSGLRMLMVFFALSIAVGLLISESWPYRLVLFASAIPIAIIANTMRIASTGAMYVYLANSQVWGISGEEFATKFFHDWAGWFMMPIGLFLLWLEIWIFDRLVIRVDDRPVAAGIPPSSPSRRLS